MALLDFFKKDVPTLYDVDDVAYLRGHAVKVLEVIKSYRMVDVYYQVMVTDLPKAVPELCLEVSENELTNKEQQPQD